MRCPKCGFISFDKEEICGGCKKNISKFSQELSGVVLRGNVPDFLWFQKPEEEPEPEEEATEEEYSAVEENSGLNFGAAEEATDDNTVEFAAEEEAKEIEFDLSMDTGAAEEEVKEEIAFDLPGMKEEAVESSKPAPAKAVEGSGLSVSADETNFAEQEPSADMAVDGLDDLDFDLEDADLESEPPPKSEKSPPTTEKSGNQAKKDSAKKELGLDLSGLDLSGLMPLPIENEEVGSKIGSKAVSKKGKAKSAADMLPDLSLGSLDLNEPSMPPVGSSAGGKLSGAAAKTGTALDEFDIDLGELLGGSGKKK